jgi:hypothetical protein
MSIRFIITPFDPQNWETTMSDLQINVKDFKNSLVDNWKDAEVEITPKGGLLWSIPDGGGVGFRGEVQSNRQIVTFAPGNWATCKEFVLWYRRQIPEKYALHLFNSSSTDNLIISSQTATDDIERFISQK